MEREYNDDGEYDDTELVILTLDQVNNKKYNGRGIEIYQLERGSSNGYYIAEIEYIENEEDDNPFENY